jgi:hypothetical protein
MIAGRKYWIIIWYGILVLGILGLWASLYWGRRTRWKNLDEILRAFGTILVSVGMLLLLHRPTAPRWGLAGELLLLTALATFISAFLLGRSAQRQGGERTSGELVAPPPPPEVPPPARPADDEVSRNTSSAAAPRHTS